ncbi:hypothetical protein LTR17_021359 [Elasticomyces elasticus]|nr:hypothetical protein LTR17_021359 [Elasticomyces elasticus]
MAFRSLLLRQQHSSIRGSAYAQLGWTSKGRPVASPFASLARRPTTCSTGRDPRVVLAEDDDSWPSDSTSSALYISRRFRNLGHKYWGFTVYRCTYSDDLAWEQLMTRLHRYARESLEESGMEDLVEFLDIPVHEDAELEGASKDVVRRRFKTWLATDAHRERLHADAKIIDIGGRGTTPRYLFCLHVDEEALRSVIPIHDDTSTPDETIDIRDRGGFLNLIDANWALPCEEEAEEMRREHEVEDPYDEGFEAVDGCRMQDVGWMRVDIRLVMPGFYAEVLHGYWEFNYE